MQIFAVLQETVPELYKLVNMYVLTWRVFAELVTLYIYIYIYVHNV